MPIKIIQLVFLLNSIVPTGLFDYIYNMYQKHNKAKVIQKGFQLFWGKGYSYVGVDEICKATGMTKGAFYNAFKSKENFLLSCIESYGLMNTEHLRSELKDDNRKAIDAISSMYINMLENQPRQKFIGCMINNIMSETASINETVRKASADAFESLLEVIEPAIQKAQREGDISSSLDSKSVTELIHSTFFGVLTRTKSTKDEQKAISTMTLLINSLK